MRCSACNHENRPGAKFCEECAAPLKRVCAGCGSELRPTAKFCDECGAATAASGARGEPQTSGAQRARPVEAAGARKVVTVVFADLIGSTSLHERLDAESARLFMESYYGAMRGAVEAHDGTVAKLLGDGVLAVFGAPRVAEDDAPRAVRAGVEMQRVFHALAAQHGGLVGAIGLRVAINTGEVVASDEAEIIGDPVNVAARLQEQARDGDVVVGEATQRLVSALVTLAPLGSFALKGRSEAVKVYRVVSLERPAGVAATSFVGREDELARITRVYAAAVAAPAARLAVLLGSPGLGKSRLIDEFARRCGNAASVLTAHCDAAGGATFAPLAEAVREYLHIDDGTGGDALHAAIEAAVAGDVAERARIVAGITALLAGAPASPEETFFVVRRLLAALAAVRPVVLVIDDLHWAEPLLLDLVEHLVQWGGGVALLVLVGARPELRETRSSLATPGGLVAEVMTLAGLDAGAATRLAANVIGATDLPAAVAAKVLAASEGNPLFVGELVRMLVHEGALKREGDRWTTGAALAALEMPPTIHALLAARIERLRPEERLVLERAAVVGRHFSRSAVAELLPREVTDLDARLESLRRSELIERDTGWFLGEPVLRFHHVLIRDAAYRRLLKGTRAELHGRFADWIEAHAGDSVEHDETIGWHLEQAHQHLHDLGPIDGKGRALGERAARHLAAAGRRALARDDVPLAAGLLGRALARLDADDPTRADLALDWCEALLAAGDVGPAATAIDELARLTAGSQRLRAWHTCFAGQLTVLTAPQALHATADAVAAAAAELTSLGDAAGEAKAHFVHAQALARLGKVGACEAALDRALAAARRAGDRRRANAVLAGAPLAALWGPSPVTRASGRCLDVVRVLRITQGAPAVEAVALSCQGVLEALRGRTDAARRMIASSRKMVEELGITHRLLEADVFAGQIDLLEGDAVAAERSLRGAYEGLRDLGLGIDAAQAAALLARALLAQGRAAEAEALSHESEALAGDDLKAAIAWRGVRAQALARRGEHAVAVELAEAAVAIASATDALLDHADARLALAAALRAAGRSSEADTEERRATELWEAKGATLLAERARRGGERIEAPTHAREEGVALPRPLQRRVRANAATAWLARFDAAFAAGDLDAVAALYADSFEALYHPTEATYGRQGVLDSFRRMFRWRDPRTRDEVLATLGESLVLARRGYATSGTSGGPFDVGESEVEMVVVTEVDERGRLVLRAESFAPDQLNDAIARLYERYAELLPEGPARSRAAATARAVAAILASSDAEWVSVLAPDVEEIDHRRLGTWNARGSHAVLEHLRSLHEVADEITFHTHEVLRLEPGALLVDRMHSGTHHLGGGSYERPLLMIVAFAADGGVARIEFFDYDGAADALASFDELAGATAKPRPVRRRVRPNAASVATDRFAAVFAARDDAALESLFSDSLTVIDHPTGAGYGREGHLDSVRRLLRASDPKLQFEPLATLGESLSLSRSVVAASGTSGGRFDVAAWEREEPSLFEVDERGRIRRLEIFAADRLSDAIARLYARHAELLPGGPARTRAEATARVVAAFLGAADLDAYCAVLQRDFELVDRRVLGFGTVRGVEGMREHLSALFEIADEFTVRVDDVLAQRSGAILIEWTTLGAARVGGGTFERHYVQLWIFGSDGLFARMEHFDFERVDDAFARFDEIVGSSEDAAPTAAPTAARFANAATRAWDRMVALWLARDWQPFAAVYAPEFRYVDRRRLLRLDLDRERFLEFTRSLGDMGSTRIEYTVLATRGDRLALMRHRLRAAGGEVGPSEMELLNLIETNSHGDAVTMARWDLDENDAAYAELDARYDAGEATVHERASRWLRGFRRALAGRDWDALVALCALDIVARNHRLVGWGTLRGPASWVEALQRLLELAPDTRLHVDHVRTSARGVLFEGAWLGTHDGGEFEIPVISAVELDELGRQLRLDVYDVTQLDDARTRFGAIGVSSAERAAPVPLCIPPNAATRAWDRAVSYVEAGDWDGFRALCRPVAYEDRRRLIRITGDCEVLVANARQLAQNGWRRAHTVLATAGDRLALQRILWSVGNTGEVSEVEMLEIIEVDAEGRWVADVIFDPNDRAAASAELFERYVRSGANRMPAALIEYIRAWNDHDLGRMRSLLPDDFFFHDHRRTGVGRVEAADAHIASLGALYELSHDVRLEQLYEAAAAQHAHLWVRRWVGTNAEGGEFESVFAGLWLYRGERFAGVELFELEDLDAALARFEELRPDPRRIPPNAAARVRDRWGEAVAARDWAAVRSLVSDDFTYEDRGKRALVSGDIEMWIASMQYNTSLPGFRYEFELIGTVGHRIALERMVWTGGHDGDAFETVHLWLFEVDALERVRTVILFDPEDRSAASLEGLARFVTGEGAGIGGRALVLETYSALARRDWDGVRATMAPSLVFHDHRTLGMGMLDRDRGVASLRALVDLSPDTVFEVSQVLAWNRHGLVIAMRTFGTVPGGGPFENVFVTVMQIDGERVQRYEVFDCDDAERAVARFEELGATFAAEHPARA